jgi:peptide chain release factor 2
MADLDYAREIEFLRGQLAKVEEAYKPQELRLKSKRLEEQSSQPDIWSNAELAKSITGELSAIRAKLSQLNEFISQLADIEVLYEIAREEETPEAWNELGVQVHAANTRISEMSIEALLSGEYDSLGALITIRAGAGGDDATDFAEMLMRMYLRYIEKLGFKAQVLDTSQAEGAGIKSTIIQADFPYAFGKLSVENGTHRLVRMSPFNSAGKRQTSFAAVEVVPLIEPTSLAEIPDSEIRVDVFRSSGPGGQSVNTTDSAVRITHIPSGIVVSCQNEKSQLQNKQAAMRVLQSKLLERKRQEEEQKLKNLSGDVKASWGEQMRSYVLAPYQMVKDLRTGYEVNNPQAVFDGDLDGFISAGISWRARQN